MNESIVTIFIEKSGLILNLIGTLLIAFSFNRNLGGAYQKDNKGRKIYLASFVSPLKFKIGMVLLFLGFLIQIFTG
jgi:hypothetical protein